MDYNPRTTDIMFIKGVGEYRAKLFNNIGIQNVNDLFEYFPKDYIQREIDTSIRHLKVGQFISMKVTVFACEEITTKNGVKQLKAIVTDGDRFLECIWFRYGKWTTKLLKNGNNIWVNGQVGEYYGNLQITHPQIEPAKDDDETPDFWKQRKILPIYRLTANLTQNTIRNAIYNGFALYHQNIDETLPDFIIKKYNFLDRKTALQKMHFASRPTEIPFVKSRFIYEEFFYLQLMIAKNAKLKTDIVKEKRCKEVWNVESGMLSKDALLNNETTPNSSLHTLQTSLPYTLTNAQKRVINEIFHDMTSTKPMNRLLQGDVGAGKTIVTLFAILLAIENGYQTAFIAPTEILAEQHYENIKKVLSAVTKTPHSEINITLIKGGKSKQKTIDKERIKNGEINLAIGTHALFQKDVEFKNLSLVVIDEQHRFGVAQRAELSLRHGFPDLLYLSATPIPRSLAMTIFGEMSVSCIDELPPTRKPVRTILTPATKRGEVYQKIDAEIKNGRQVYIVCPLIEENENLDLQDAESLYLNISEHIFPMYRSALLHSKIKSAKKEQIMKDFATGEINILVSTTVIEVGIDVPNASVMVIEHSERFGLAQLHQLRGRVGRGADQSYCYLIAHNVGEIARQRLDTMVKTNDGFVIAEKDLELRGPGDMFGTAQSGLPEFRFANLVTDQNWLNIAKVDAELIIADDPELNQKPHKIIKNHYNNYITTKETFSKF